MIQELQKSEILVILILFVGAFAIRSIGIDWGLPSQQFPYSQFNQDETAELFGTLQISEGIYQLGLLGYQPFFYYISFLFFAFFFLFGLVTGNFTSLSDFQTQYGFDLAQFFVAGRYFMVAVGATTVVLTYIVGRYMFGRRTGFVAAVFLAISFGHAVYSKIFRLDSLLPLVFLFAFYMIIKLKDAKPGKLRSYILTGIAVAAAATTKKTGFALVVPFLLIPVIEGWVSFRWPPKLTGIDRRYPFSVTVFLATLVALTGPYFVFLSAYRASTQEMATSIVTRTAKRFTSAFSSGNSYALSPYRWSLPWHLTSTLPNELGITTYVLALVGLFLMVFDKNHRREVTYLLITLVAFLLPIGLMARAPWRDMLPILPLLAIGAGYGFVRLIEYLTRRQFAADHRLVSKLLIVILVLLVVLPPFFKLLDQQFLTLNTDTREKAKDWIEKNIPADSNIAMEPFGPGIIDNSFREEIRLRMSAKEGTSGESSTPAYNISMLVEEVGHVLDPDQVVPYLIENEIEYVVLSSAFYGRLYNEGVATHLPDLGEAGRSMHDVIEGNLEFLVQFIPDWQKTPGPVIKVYRVPQDLGGIPVFSEGRFVPYPGIDRPASAVGYYQFAPR
ncbi:MAG: phospholipid carrier-dependent glycosyltransferase [Candidatus Promineifilaceae bacterium]